MAGALILSPSAAFKSVGQDPRYVAKVVPPSKSDALAFDAKQRRHAFGPYSCHPMPPQKTARNIVDGDPARDCQDCVAEKHRTLLPQIVAATLSSSLCVQ